MRGLITLSVFASMLFAGLPAVFPHCQMPCGIYDDQMRLDMIAEDITTIEKAMKEIETLSKASKINYNQLVRWVDTKEEHANMIQETVTQYFMTQRLAPTPAKDEKAHASYVEQLTLLHQMLVHAMKAKQTTDLAHVEKLRSLLTDYGKASGIHP